jgi:hypothetical protein
VSLYNSAGDRIWTIRIARMPESKKVVLHQQLVAELRQMIELYPEGRLQACADGAKENWRIIDEIEKELGIHFERTLDAFHAKEHLAGALNLYSADNPDQAKHDVAYFGRILTEEPDGPRRVIKALEYRVARVRGKKKTKIQKELNYFNRHKAMMNYHELHAKHWPIGSGIQEAACKTLVVERLKQSGMSWDTPGGQGILTLRGLDQSGRWAHAWDAIHRHLLETRAYNIDTDPGRQRPRRAA